MEELRVQEVICVLDVCVLAGWTGLLYVTNLDHFVVLNYYHSLTISSEA